MSSMKTPEPFSDLGTLLGALVVAPAQAQSLLDQQWDREASRWEAYAAHFLAQAPAAWRREVALLLGPTTPVRQVIGRTELGCHFRLRLEHARRWSVKAQALGLGWEALYGKRREQALQVSFVVEAVPLPAAPSATTGLPVTGDTPLQATSASVNTLAP